MGSNVGWIVVAAITVLGALGTLAVVIFKIGTWKGKVDSGMSGAETSMDGLRSEMRDFMKEIRSDVKKIFNRLSPTTGSGKPNFFNQIGEKGFQGN